MSTAAIAVRRDQTPAGRLDPAKIRYLALEGGGGKGIAYLGAIAALEDIHVMQHIDGVAVTSAGAITALMLSLGMTAADIEAELTSYDFNLFFDPPAHKPGYRFVPAPFIYEERANDKVESAELSGSIDPRAVIRLMLDLKERHSSSMPR
jgi:predicted acylesterase/phospholipase RssA